MGLSKEFIQERVEAALKYPMQGPLSIGTMERFREGLVDFRQWAAGVISGPIPWIADRLATVMAKLSIKTLDIDPARNFDWQQSDLEGFCYRIQALLPEGTLAGYYLGRIGKKLYAAFGYTIMTDETAPPPASTVKPPPPAPAPESPGKVPSDFHGPLFDMMGCIMCADSRINPKEIQTICRILTELDVPWTRAEVEKRLRDFIQRVRSQGLACIVEQTLARIRDSACRNIGTLWLDCIDRVVRADGFVDPREMDVRQKFIDAFGGVPQEPQEFDVETEVDAWAQEDDARRVSPANAASRSAAEREAGAGSGAVKQTLLQEMNVSDTHPRSPGTCLCAEYFILVMRFPSKVGAKAALQEQGQRILQLWASDYGSIAATTYLAVDEHTGDIGFGVKSKGCTHWSQLRDPLEILRIECQREGAVDVPE